MDYEFELKCGVSHWMTSEGPSVRITTDVTGDVVELLKTPEQVRAIERVLRDHLYAAIDAHIEKGFAQ